MSPQTMNRSVFHSRLFTFVVGDNAPITVHSGAVAAISTPLKELMDEETPDGPRTSATLDVREEDFVRFCDYIYTNDYANPYPVVVKPASNASPNASPSVASTDAVMIDQTKETEVPAEGSKNGQPALKRARTEAPPGTPAKPLLSFGRPSAINAPTAGADIPAQNRARLASVFEKYPGKLSRSSTFGSNNNNNNAPKINHPTEDHTNVLVAHAAMFALADRFDVAGLKLLSLAKLKERLARLELVPCRAADVTNLVRHVYSSGGGGGGGGANELRDLVSRYVASEVGVVGHTREFRNLLQEGGAFVKDFWTLVFGTLLSSGIQVPGPDVFGGGKE